MTSPTINYHSKSCLLGLLGIRFGEWWIVKGPYCHVIIWNTCNTSYPVTITNRVLIWPANHVAIWPNYSPLQILSVFVGIGIYYFDMYLSLIMYLKTSVMVDGLVCSVTSTNFVQVPSTKFVFKFWNKYHDDIIILFYIILYLTKIQTQSWVEPTPPYYYFREI